MLTQQERTELLGAQASDVITGFEGVVTGLVDYISGCSQALIVPRVDKEGKLRDGQWFDVQRLKIADVTNVNAKRVVLDNAATPGPDAAPNRSY